MVKLENKTRFELDPVIVQIGSVQERLRYVNLQRKDEQSRYNIFKRATMLAQTPQDWENIARLFLGFQHSHSRLKFNLQEMVIRKLCEAGHEAIVLRLLHESQKSMLSLRSQGIRSCVITGVHQMAVSSGWEENVVKTGLNYAEQIIELLERECQGRNERLQGNNDPRRDPVVIALALELAAVKIKLGNQNQNADNQGQELNDSLMDKTSRYTVRLLGVLQQMEPTIVSSCIFTGVLIVQSYLSCSDRYLEKFCRRDKQYPATEQGPDIPNYCLACFEGGTIIAGTNYAKCKFCNRNLDRIVQYYLERYSQTRIFRSFG
jgi:hypothetical protein